MFDFAWTEIALIGVVALVLIGPKDMPVAIKAMTGMVKKARRMAAEFQGHVEEMVRDTELADVRQQINEIRNFDIRGGLERALDEDGSLRKAFSDPFATSPATDHAVASDTAAAEDGAEATDLALTGMPGEPVPSYEAPAALRDVPAFIPPAVAAALEAPAFIPPQAAQGSHARPPFA